MNSANDAQKIEDPEKQVLHAPSISTDSSPHLDISDLKTEGEVDAKSKKMMKVQHLCFSLILLALLGLTLVSCSSPPRHGSPMSPEERLQFQALLNTIEPASLHDVLHKHLKEKYKHGVYQEDKAAMEVVAQSNVEVAHSLIEVAKRQASNTSTVIAVVTTTTAVTTDVPPVTTTPVVVPPTTTPVTTNNPPTTSPTTQATTTLTQQTLPSGTTTTPTTVQIPATTPASSKPGSTTSPTKTGTSNVQSSSPPDTLRTEASSARSVTQQTVFTTTLPNGAVSTVTSVTVVPAGQAEKTGSATKTNGNASLQTNAANSKGLGLGGVIGMLGMVAVGAL